MIKIFINLMLLLISVPVFAVESENKNIDEHILIVTGYKYIQETMTDNQEIGHSICGIRCNALSANYRNIMEPGGWSITRINSGKEIMIETENRLISGHCICIADEYQVKPDIRAKILRSKGSMAGTFYR